jgi:hypothetical protein
MSLCCIKFRIDVTLVYKILEYVTLVYKILGFRFGAESQRILAAVSVALGENPYSCLDMYILLRIAPFDGFKHTKPVY